MDYKNKCNLKLFNNFYDFKKDKKNGRIILMTTKAKNKYFDFKFKQNDIILFGRESALGYQNQYMNELNYQLSYSNSKKYKIFKYSYKCSNCII